VSERSEEAARAVRELKELVSKYGEDSLRWLTSIRDRWVGYKTGFRCYDCGASVRWVSDFEYECENGHRKRVLGLESWELGVPPWFMRVLVDRGLVEVLYRSRSATCYGIPDTTLEAIEQVLTGGVEEAEEVGAPPPEPSADMFSDIVGLDDVKELVVRVLRSEKPVHLLLVGPPASAKTMILEAISKHYNVPILLAGSSTKAGLRDYIAENSPEIMLIDELDKVSNPLDLSVLLTWMESQRLTITMGRKKAFIKCPRVCKVIAAANRTDKIPPELLSRFVVVTFRQYTEEEVRTICLNILTKKEGVSEEMAKVIVDAVINELGSRDPRNCVKIARIAKSPEEVEKVVATMKKR